MNRQFVRIERFIGKEKTEKLFSSTVAVVGIGAVGGFATEMLARCGIGHLIIMDFDTISESNINRQIVALHSTIGCLKTDVMKERILDINPECIVDDYPVALTDDNHSILFSADVILDCIDSIDAKVSLLLDSWKQSRKIISSMGAALRKDTSLIQTGDVMNTYGCPLAKSVRTRLRKNGCGRGIRCVFSPEQVDFCYTPPAEDDEAEGGENGRKRMVLGSLPYVTAVFGEKMAEETVKMLLEI